MVGGVAESANLTIHGPGAVGVKFAWYVAVVPATSVAVMSVATPAGECAHAKTETGVYGSPFSVNVWIAVICVPTTYVAQAHEQTGGEGQEQVVN